MFGTLATVATAPVPIAGPPHGIDARRAAWVGLIQAHQEMSRALDAELQARHGLALSGYEVLAHLAAAEDGHLRLTHLAERAQLSLSRVSRLFEALERRGLVARAQCPGDSRVVHAVVTDEGRELADAARRTFDGIVEDGFLGRLEPGEVEALAGLLGKVVTAPLGSSCPGAG